MQSPVPVQAPLQPPKRDPVAAVASTAMTVPAGYAAVQLPDVAPAAAAQLSGGWTPSAVAMVPPPPPVPDRPSAKLRFTKRAVTLRA